MRRQCPSHPPEHSLDTAGCCPACLDDDCVCDEWDIVQGHWNCELRRVKCCVPMLILANTESDYVSPCRLAADCIYFQSFFCNGKDTILCDGCPNAGETRAV